MDVTPDKPDTSGTPIPLGIAMTANPRSVYKELRGNSPVLALEGTGVAALYLGEPVGHDDEGVSGAVEKGHCIVLSRKVDVDEVLRHPETFSSIAAVDLKSDRPLIPLQIDPPDHKKFRKLLDPIFAPRLMAKMEEDVARLVNDLIDRFIDKGEADFAAEFSVSYPSQVFLTLLGLPLEELNGFLAMKDGIIRPGHVTGTAHGSETADAYQQKVATMIYAYFNKVLDQRASEPKEDLVSMFLSAEIEGNRLTREDILDICFLFLIAGLDTVGATLDCIFGFLAQNPEYRQQLVDDPSSIPSAIEELLRWESPVPTVLRTSLADTTLGGCPVSKGDSVVLLLGSANTDDSEVEDADTVRFDRDVNRHIAFGGGIHRCLGSHLARMELRVALREWHRRIPEYWVEPGHTLVYTPSIRSIEYFPMRFPTGGTCPP
jgi:cytochrome P450